MGLLMIILVIGAFLAAGVLVGIVVWLRQRTGRSGDGDSLRGMRAEMMSLELIAKTSNEKAIALEHERDARQRTEQDLQFNQQLLSRALDERIQLGRDLHDHLIQTLYATGLTLESTKDLIDKQPEEARVRLTQAIDALNTAIREVRTHISGLQTEALRHTGFRTVLAEQIDLLRAGRDVSCDLRLDDDALSLLTIEQSREAMQIVREAVSNSLRHGAATALTLRLHRDERTLALLVKDNGRGFDPASAAGSDGKGLANMKARAERLGGQFRLESRLGEGTRIVLTLPIL